jgi:hypothetical protein
MDVLLGLDGVERGLCALARAMLDFIEQGPNRVAP